MSNALMAGGNSVAAQAYVPQAPNVFEQAGQIAQSQNALIGLQANQMQLQARQALGQAYQQATDPNTGAIDQNKLMGAISQSPAAYMLGDIQQRNLANIHAQLENQGISLQQAITKVNYGRSVYGSLLADPNSTPADVIKAAGQSVADGVQSSQEAAQHIESMPTQNGPQFRQWLQQQNLQLLSAQERFNAINPHATTVSNGAYTIPGAQDPGLAGGAFHPAGAPIPNQLSPGEASTYVQTGVGPNGQPIYQPKGAVAGGQAAQSGFGPNNGRYNVPSSLMNPANQAPASAGYAALGPGQEATLKEQAGISNQQAAALSNGAADSQNRLSALSQLEQDSGGFTGGVGAGTTLALKSAYNRFAPSILQLDTKGVAAQEAFNKTAQMVINQQSQALGGGSDARLDATVHANVNENISTAGKQEILPILKGNELAIQAKNQAWQAERAQNPSTDYQRWSTEFNKTFDPRLYQAQFMTAAQRQAMVGSLKGPDRAHFAAALRANPQLMAPAAEQFAPAPAATPASQLPGPNGA